MQIIIRTDASILIGAGHVMRCLTLACQLKNLGATVEFICRESPGNLCDFITACGYRVHRLPYQCSNNTYDKWLGADLSTDVSQTKNILANQEFKPDWIIIDHYSLGARWEQEIRPLVNKIMVIDDLANRYHDCDLLLDQNLCKNYKNRYECLITDECVRLLGPQYAMLRSEFINARKTLRDRDGMVRQILIFFGGSDPTNETAKALEAIRLLSEPSIKVDVVVGAINPNKGAIAHMCSLIPNVTFYCQVNNMAELMAKADLAIGAGGTATWERCCVGLSSLVISVADNQEDISHGCHDAGVINYLGISRTISYDIIAKKIKYFLQQPSKLQQMSQKALDLVDGLGVLRVAKTLYSEL